MIKGDAESFADLLDVLLPTGSAIIVLRYCYFDESGTHRNSPAMAMAGYVFEKEQAQRFARDWTKDLHRYGIPFAHMTDCATGNGQYRDLSKEDRINSVKSLIMHIKRRSMVGVAVAVDMKSYNETFYGRYDHDAYTFCVAMCIKSIHEWAERVGFSGRFAYFFEAGHAAQSEANRAISHIRESKYAASYHSHSFVDKRDAPQIQAADLLAWQYAHRIKRYIDGYQTPRKDFTALLRPKDILIGAGPDAVQDWKGLMRELDDQIVEAIRLEFPDTADQAEAWVRSRMIP